MQVLKPEIRKKILSAAEQLFYEMGFEKTSTRNIADAVGISVSNLYKYFADKQAILSFIVDPFFQQTKDDMAALFDEAHTAMDPNIIRVVTEEIIRLITTDRRKFVILMGRSNGTPYENFKDRIVEMLTQHLKESINPQILENDYILRLLAENFFQGILKIAENPLGDPSSIETSVNTLVRYHMAGIAQFC